MLGGSGVAVKWQDEVKHNDSSLAEEIKCKMYLSISCDLLTPA